MDCNEINDQRDLQHVLGCVAAKIADWFYVVETKIADGEVGKEDVEKTIIRDTKIDIEV